MITDSLTLSSPVNIQSRSHVHIDDVIFDPTIHEMERGACIDSTNIILARTQKIIELKQHYVYNGQLILNKSEATYFKLLSKYITQL